MQPATIDPTLDLCTRYPLRLGGPSVDQVWSGSVEHEVCSTILHMASTGNRTPDLLILSPMAYPRGATCSLCPRNMFQKPFLHHQE